MKTISMEYEEYQNDLQGELNSGIDMGISLVMKFLESGKKMEDFLLEHYEGRHHLTTNEEGKTVFNHYSHWGRIKTALEKK
jgi:hypothetical protein